RPNRASGAGGSSPADGAIVSKDFASGVKRILVRRFATYLRMGVPGNWVLQSDLQNPNRTRMDWASRVSRSGIGAAGSPTNTNGMADASRPLAQMPTFLIFD